MPKKGYKQTPEHKAKLRKAKMGHKVSDETRKIQSKAKMGNKYAIKRGTQQICTNCGKLKDYFYNGYCEECADELGITDRPRSRYKNIPLMYNPYPDDVIINTHHIHDWFTVPIPEGIHRKCQTGSDKAEHRERCNLWLYYLYGGLDFDRLINGA